MRINETDVLHTVPESKPEDRSTIAKLANVFWGLTHTPPVGPTAKRIDRETRQFCILSAVRILAEMRALIRLRGL